MRINQEFSWPIHFVFFSF